MRTKKRTLLTTKVYGFNPWMDQVTAINELMDSLGQKSEAPIIRDLIDEALAARRRKSAQIETKPETQAATDLIPILEIIQGLLLKLIAREDRAFRMQSVGFELIQETLLEAHAGRNILWETLVAPALAGRGKSAYEIAELLEKHLDQGKDFSYGLAEEVTTEVNADDGISKPSEQERSQPQLNYGDESRVELNDFDIDQGQPS
ncbi:MAG TPA: hypothetical protein VIG25_06270 [Pyrinomonadaceae bacterium]|jgi:predicted DNA-binding protein